MRLFRLCLKNVWRVFSFAFVTFGLLAAYSDGDDLLHSDDPYLTGFLAGGVAACLALLDSLLQEKMSSKRIANLVLLGLVTFWCNLLMLLPLNGGEARELYPFAAGASAGIALLVWVLLRIPVHAILSWLMTLATLAGIVFYVVIATRML